MPDLTIEEKSWIIGRMYRLIGEYFAHWEDASFTRDELDDVFRDYLNRGLAATTRNQFVTVLQQWIGSLHNGHSWCYDSEFQDGAQLGFQMERMEDGWVVIGSIVDEVVEGDVVELIDGLSPDEWMIKAELFLTVLQPKSRELQWQHHMPSMWNAHQATLRVRGRDEKARDITYKPFRLDEDDPRTHSPKANRNRERQQHTEGRWIRDEVGYIRIPSFSEPHYAQEALSYLQQFWSANAIVLDIRFNDGGSTPSSITEAMMNRPYRWWTETSPNVGYLRRRHPDASQFTVFPDGSGARCVGNWQEPAETTFTGNVTLLASRYAGSAAEDFIMPFKDTGRGVVAGEPTWGSTGQPRSFEYKGIHVGIGSVRASMPDGTLFEGVGIQPDISVWRTREDLYSGRDSVLEKALQLR